MTYQADDPTLKIFRRFSVPPEMVFDAFTQPKAMRVWWGENVSFEIDLQVGGRYTIVRTEGETTYTAIGEYLAVDKPYFLRYTFGMPQYSPNSDTITVSIEEDGSGSLLNFEHAGVDIANELRELTPGEQSPSEMGWQQGFDLIAAGWDAEKE